MTRDGYLSIIGEPNADLSVHAVEELINEIFDKFEDLGCIDDEEFDPEKKRQWAFRVISNVDWENEKSAALKAGSYGFSREINLTGYMTFMGVCDEFRNSSNIEVFGYMDRLTLKRRINGVPVSEAVRSSKRLS
jgi:hypothetical protein